MIDLKTRYDEKTVGSPGIISLTLCIICQNKIKSINKRMNWLEKTDLFFKKSKSFLAMPSSVVIKTFTGKNINHIKKDKNYLFRYYI